MRERGSALLTAVIAIMVLLMISGVLFTLVNYQFKLETSEEKGLKAYYIAEAGINYGEAMVRKEPDKYFGDQSPYLTEQPLIQNKQFNEGVFNVTLVIQPSEQNYVFTVKSTGNYQGIDRSMQEQYTFLKPIQP